MSTGGAVGLALGWLVLTLALGWGVATFAGTHLEGVVRTVEQDFSRSFWLGVAGQLALFPVLGIICVALLLTLIGAVVIPVAVVGFLLAAVGMGALGFLATAQLTGGAFLPAASRTTLPARRVGARGLAVGIVFYTGLWLVAALLTPFPLAAAIARGVAFAATWVAATAGFGAALWSRAGTRVPAPRATPPDATVDDYAWSTPTPLTGVAAARRAAPTPTHTEVG
jgi:hypothetical protein